jgi:hypothetical protein
VEQKKVKKLGPSGISVGDPKMLWSSGMMAGGRSDEFLTGPFSRPPGAENYGRAIHDGLPPPPGFARPLPLGEGRIYVLPLGKAPSPWKGEGGDGGGTRHGKPQYVGGTHTKPGRALLYTVLPG